MEQTLSSRSIRRFIVGSIMIAIGVVLILMNVGVIAPLPIRGMWAIWPLVFIGIGLYKISESADADGRRSGFILLAIGAWFELSYFEVFGLSFADSWPLLVIALGISVIWKASTRRSLGSHRGHSCMS